MSCASWHVIRRPEYGEDLDAIAAWVAGAYELVAHENYIGRRHHQVISGQFPHATQAQCFLFWPPIHINV